MLWKIYFVIFVLLQAVGLLVDATHLSRVSLVEWVDQLVFVPLFIAALWAVAFHRTFLPASVWKAILFASVTWEIFAVGLGVDNAVTANQAKIAALGPAVSGAVVAGAVAGALLMSLLLVVPPLIALYKNGYGRGPETAALPA